MYFIFSPQNKIFAYHFEEPQAALWCERNPEYTYQHERDITDAVRVALVKELRSLGLALCSEAVIV